MNNQYIVKLSNGILINEKTFEPKIYHFKNSVSVFGFFNYPYNMFNIKLPKKFNGKNISISKFDKNNIIITQH